MSITADDYNALTTALGGICFALTRRLPAAERQPLLQDLVATARGWRMEVGGEVLGGGYRSAQSALDDLYGGHTFSHSACADTSALGVPDDLGAWEFVPLRR
jgi:hypothetical protein